MQIFRVPTPETWHKLPWLTVATVMTVIGAVMVLMLTLAMWRLPAWEQNLRPVARHVIQHQLPLLARYPQATWSSQTPARGVHTSPDQPRYVSNATPVFLWPDTPKIAVVIDDMGVAAELSQAMVETMPKEVTFAFLPYGGATMNLAQLSRLKGHEIMIHLPMQPKSLRADPGPNALLVTDDTPTLDRKITTNLKDLKSFAVGVNNHMGSAVTSNPQKMAQILHTLQQERLFFLDSVTTPTPASDALKGKFTLPILKRSVFLDHYIEGDKIHEYLTKTEEYARRHGTAIAIGHPHKLTREALLAWIPTLPAKGLQLVPITNLIEKK